ncbi:MULTISPECIES: hypothetical protein [Thermoactinomyces]|jgi:hypothetical protein|uniref:Uncharacterized protein n=1 Tax=Thermoactinomyces daqus TaxID=1329516 RepID=A0A7W2AG67_9BACL|nr:MULTISPECIES: hypothetical protein [Thermoactinomyces]MBA4541902.1 hypothetical protein [Thermoactinomyces daqus]MBH8604254.1 hypothetical protein [Thermoactinomyces sp. CICC 10522]MBH8607709.1 hypothetical protein [Thermoactinomyces sp. CICC 10521]
MKQIVATAKAFVFDPSLWDNGLNFCRRPSAFRRNRQSVFRQTPIRHLSVKTHRKQVFRHKPGMKAEANSKERWDHLTGHQERGEIRSPQRPDLKQNITIKLKEGLL